MPSYSMNIGIPEQDREINDMGFDNVTVHSSKISTSMPTVPYRTPTPIGAEVVETSDTIKRDIGPSAHDIVVGSH